jgi:GntR family transcriptional regulator
MISVLKENDQLPSVRSLSRMLDINPTTVQKSYKLMEEEKVIYSKTGKGYFVSNVELIQENTTKLKLEHFEKVLKDLKKLDIDEKRISESYKKVMEGKL